MKIKQLVIIKPGKISLSATENTKTLDELFNEGYQEYPTPNEIIQTLNDGTKRHPKVSELNAHY